MILAVTLLLAFLLGSVLGGQVVGRLRGLDLRNTGSGNLGATNALRSGGISSGLSVLLFDAGKAILAIWLAGQIVPQSPTWLPWACGVIVVLGHVFSPLAGFRGGKGVASGLGASLCLLPWASLVGVLGFVFCLVLTGYVSLSVLLACCLILLKVTCFDPTGIWSPAGAFSLGMLLLLCWTHRDNLKRLSSGTESRFEKIMLIKPR